MIKLSSIRINIYRPLLLIVSIFILILTIVMSIKIDRIDRRVKYIEKNYYYLIFGAKDGPCQENIKTKK